MSLYECSKCGTVVSANGKPDECPACESSTNASGVGGNPFHRIDDVDELLS